MTAEDYLKKPSNNCLVVNTLNKLSIQNGDAKNLLKGFALEKVVEALKNLRYTDGTPFLNDINKFIPKDLTN